MRHQIQFIHKKKVHLYTCSNIFHVIIELGISQCKLPILSQYVTFIDILFRLDTDIVSLFHIKFFLLSFDKEMSDEQIIIWSFSIFVWYTGPKFIIFNSKDSLTTSLIYILYLLLYYYTCGIRMCCTYTRLQFFVVKIFNHGHEWMKIVWFRGMFARSRQILRHIEPKRVQMYSNVYTYIQICVYDT